MRLLVFLVFVALLWRTCTSQIDYCNFVELGGALQAISMDGPINLFLDAPQSVCIGCLFFVGGSQSVQPGTVYEITKDGGSATPLVGMPGVTVNDNGTLFVEDASAIFDADDTLECTFMSTTRLATVVALIFGPPTLDPSGIVDITEGDDLTLSCEDPGNTNNERYQWFNDSNGMDVTDDIITPPLVYTITNIQRAASGNYSCVLTDGNIPNIIPTSTVTVNVQYPALISSIAPTNIVSPRTTTVSIVCVYDGNPDPMVSWVREMDLLNDAFDNVTITTTSTESTLTLSNIQPSDSGNYRCITNNTIGPGNVDGSIGGYASDNATLVVQVAPAPVDSVMIEDITNTSFTVQWMYPTGEGANGSATITGVTVTYTATNNNAAPSAGTMDVDYPDTSLPISDLEPLTGYRVSVVVNNDVKEFVGSSTAVEQTLDTLSNLLGRPTISSVMAVNSTALRATWTIPDRNTFLQTVGDVYRVRYQETASDLVVMELFVEYPETSALITGLAKGTSYTVTVAVNNTAGFSPDSDSVSGTTDVDPPTMPTNLVTFLNPESICIEWMPPVDDGGSDITQYLVEINDVRSGNLTATTRRFLFENLTNNTMYSVEVAAENSGGIGDYAGQSVTTPSDFTEESGFVLTVTNRAPFDVIVNWNVSTTNDVFKVQYKESDVEWNATAFNAILDGSEVSYKITGLEPEIDYDVRIIRVESNSCVQNVSVPQQFTTPEIMLNVGTDDGMTDVSAGGDIVLSCNLTTGGRAPDVIWTYNGGPLPSVATAEGSQLFLSDLTTNNSGNYTCTVRNATFSFSLDVAPTLASTGEILPLWAIIVIAVGAALCILVFVVVLIIVCRYVCCKKDKGKTHYDLNRRSKGDVWVDEGGSGFAPTNPGYRASIEAVPSMSRPSPILFPKDNPYEDTGLRPRTLTNQDATTTSFVKTDSREVLTEKSKDGVAYVPVTSSTFQSNAKQQTDV